ncbi:MAG: polyribonucleotide nucleotidyltransferase [Endomicrobium sp.]|jgi:polyribonucleotide nucleotidyltransferase|nr:polyribonucleotide nucleotidyltransferase [Endomicrobium sp.]
MEYFIKEIEIVGKKFIVESGKLARQSNGSCMIRVGGTVVLVTVVAAKEAKFGVNFVPLTVNYRERTYASGKIPGGFFKREAKPKDGEILISRLIDRSIRPLFPKYWKNDTQISVIVLSHDGQNDSATAAILGASIALYTSDLPFTTPVASVRIGKINGHFVVNPLINDQKFSSLNLILSGAEEALTMVEADAQEISEEEMLQALNLGKDIIKEICLFQNLLPTKAKFQIVEPQCNMLLKADIEVEAIPKAKEAIMIEEKTKRESFWNLFKKDILLRFIEKYPKELPETIETILEDIFFKKARELILTRKIRTDGRNLEEIRSITCETNMLPRVHGSGLFTRGQTQALVTVTLGTPNDMQVVDELQGEYKERFIFHYNFPGFATGEPKGERSVSRREVGHGYLAKRALKAILPNEEDFGYTIRMVSDILESNGSSSMASVCGGSLALFNAGVPVKTSCAGVAMGLVKEGNDYVILTDIMGMEDHIGDMDFKIAGTRKGITALQMDIKISGLTTEIMAQALDQAKRGRFFILDKMDIEIPFPNNNLSNFAPRIAILTIPQNKIGELIGPGGKNIRKIQEENDVKVDINENGKVFISGIKSAGVDSAKEYIKSLVNDIEIGKIYKSKIIKIVAFGAFAEIFPGKEGLIHISQLSNQRVKKIEDLLKEGDEVKVKVIEIDKQGKISLSVKAAN